MVEWIRQTIFATSALVGVNLVGVYYALFIIVPFGIVVMFAGAMVALTSDTTCQEAQPSRSLFLKLQLLGVVLAIPTTVLHIIVFKIRGTNWCHEVLNREDEEDDD